MQANSSAYSDNKETVADSSRMICKKLDTAFFFKGAMSLKIIFRSGESTRLPSMWFRFDSRTLRHMWVEFVGSLLCTKRFFSGYSGFLLSRTFDLICVNC